jgi:hypothetical protein
VGGGGPFVHRLHSSGTQVTPDDRIDLSELKGELDLLWNKMPDPYEQGAPTCSACQHPSFQKLKWLKTKLHQGHQRKSGCYLAKQPGSDIRESTKACDEMRAAGIALREAAQVADDDDRIEKVWVAFSALPDRLNPGKGPQGGGSVTSWCSAAGGFPCEALPILDAFAKAVDTVKTERHLAAQTEMETRLFNAFFKRCSQVFRGNSADSNCRCRNHKGKWYVLCPFLSKLDSQGLGRASATPLAGRAEKRSADCGSPAPPSNKKARTGTK